MKRIALICASIMLASTCIVAPARAVNYGNVLGNVGYNIGTAESEAGKPKTEILSIVGTLINLALGLLGVILLLLSLYAGFLWMTAGGNEEQVAKAKMLLRNAIIGLLITLSAYSISYFVTTNIGKATGTTSTTTTTSGG